MLAIIAAIDNDLQREFISDVYIKYYNSARAKALTFVHDEFEAEEIIQEVFVKLIKHIDVLMELSESSLSFYVMVTTKNTAIKHLIPRRIFQNGRMTDSLCRRIFMRSRRSLKHLPTLSASFPSGTKPFWNQNIFFSFQTKRLQRSLT